MRLEVGRNVHKAFHIGTVHKLQEPQSSQSIDPEGPERVMFQSRQVLQGGSVEDDLRAMLKKYVLEFGLGKNIDMKELNPGRHAHSLTMFLTKRVKTRTGIIEQ